MRNSNVDSRMAPMKLTVLCSFLVAAGCSTQRAPDAPLASTESPAGQTAATNSSAAQTRAVGTTNTVRTDTARAHDDKSNASLAADSHRDMPRADGTPASAIDRTSAAAPVATGGGPVPPDNTAVNTRDRQDSRLTPMDQGGSEADRTTTQKVRQAVIADKALSFNAKNVKIITVNGKVTLRGPVKSDAERASIEAKAREVAGAGQVDNQLEVKP